MAAEAKGWRETDDFARTGKAHFSINTVAGLGRKLFRNEA